jgi:hypothetical protein
MGERDQRERERDQCGIEGGTGRRVRPAREREGLQVQERDHCARAKDQQVGEGGTRERASA